jgi:opacity protein-like surface antigen
MIAANSGCEQCNIETYRSTSIEDTTQGRALGMKLGLAAIILVFIVAVSAEAALAQSNELAGEASGSFPQTIYNSNSAIGFQINFAHRLAKVPLFGLYGEIPFVASYNTTYSTLHGLASEQFNNYYVTPGLKLKFAPGFFLSPYLAGGIGWGHFSSNQTSATDTRFAADWGGGVDMKVFPFISLRLEMRDFYSGVPNLVLPGNGAHQNNVVVSGGPVLRF